MLHYLVTDPLTGHARIVTLEEAARYVQVAEEDIERALEKRGVCETDRHSICDIAGADVFDLTQLTALVGAEA